MTTVPGDPAFVGPSTQDWPTQAEQVALFQTDRRSKLQHLLGDNPFPQRLPLNVETVETHDDRLTWRHKLRYGNETDDVVWAWLFIPKALREPAPAVICLAGSFMTPNWAKDAPAGLAGPLIEGDPEAYGRDLAELGFVTLCPDYPCCGQRTSPGRKSHDTTELDARFPRWTRVGLSAWDVSRAVDLLQQRAEVDADRIATCGWSQGGQMAIIGAALDERVAAVVSVCGWAPLRGVDGVRARNWAQSYNFPRLAPCLNNGTPMPLDFDDIVACVAPRPLLDVRATEDDTFPNRDIHEQALRRLAALWDVADAAERLRCVQVDGEHAHGRAAAQEEQAWLTRWLAT